MGHVQRNLERFSWSSRQFASPCSNIAANPTGIAFATTPGRRSVLHSVFLHCSSETPVRQSSVRSRRIAPGTK